MRIVVLLSFLALAQPALAQGLPLPSTEHRLAPFRAFERLMERLHEFRRARDEREGIRLYRALDRVLVDLRRGDAIAPDLSVGRAVTVDADHDMFVEAAGEILEVLEGDRFRVRTADGERILSGAELRRLNLAYDLPDGSRVLPGESRNAGPTALIDRARDPSLRRFLEQAAEVGRTSPSPDETLRRLTDLVSSSLKYPHESNAEYARLDAEYTGREVPFGRYIDLHLGVCRHQALAMKLALEEVGYPSRYVAGDALARGTGAVRGGHAWVEALLPDGRRVLVDPTWRDAGVPLAEAYRPGQLRRPKPNARRVIPPAQNAAVDPGELEPSRHLPPRAFERGLRPATPSNSGISGRLGRTLRSRARRRVRRHRPR